MGNEPILRRAFRIILEVCRWDGRALPDWKQFSGYAKKRQRMSRLEQVGPDSGDTLIGMKKVHSLATSLTFVLAAISDVSGAEPPSLERSPAAPKVPSQPAEASFWNSSLVDSIKQGQLLYNARLRYEYADMKSLKRSNALTLRNRLGYQTASFYGFQGLLEFEDVRFIGNDGNANLAGTNGEPLRTVVADPEDTEINQAWLSYSNWDTSLKAGRQRIILDNARFVGNVGWRQNEQTFDAVALSNQSLSNTTLLYGYVHNVNTILGDDHPRGNLDTHAHIAHVSYSGFSAGTLTGYGYFLDVEDLPAVSSNTVGGSFDGSSPLYHELMATYRAEYAYQTEAGDNSDYSAHYYHAQMGGLYKRCSAGAGYEILTDDNGIGFSTPLATLHAFNGWADIFLMTPGNGLKDFYAWAGYELPGQIPVKFYYHKFDSNTGGADYGQEFDLAVSRRFGKHWTVLAKYAYYNAEDLPYQDTQKAWLQVEFNF